jgi:hypothetical protein
MSVNIIPTTFICDGDGNIVWQKTMYAPGDEDLIFNILEKTASVSRQ